MTTTTTFNTECFCCIKPDEPLYQLVCGHNIHYSCAIEMVNNKCPWCRTPTKLFLDIFLEDNNYLFSARIIRTRLIMTKQSHQFFVLNHDNPEESFAMTASSDLEQNPQNPPSSPNLPNFSQIGGGETSLYNGPITRSRGRGGGGGGGGGGRQL